MVGSWVAGIGKVAGGVGRWLALAALSLTLAACQSLGGAPPAASTGAPASGAGGEVIGSGPVKAALLLPRSAGGNGAATAIAFRNAAALALRDDGAGVEIHVYDTAGTAAGAQAAMGAALADGAAIVLGPVFSAEVAAVAPQARQAGVPVVAFSSDASVAGPGIYLLSFLPSDDIGTVVAFSAGEGRKSFAAIFPGTAYGAVAEAAFRRAAAAAGGRIVAIETYAPDGADLAASAAAVARVAAGVDALLIPEAGRIAPALASALAAGGVTRDRVKLLGSGQWDAPAILGSAALVGSWFPAPSRQGFDAFAARYQAAFAVAPPRNATLAYDATALAAGLAKRFGAEGFAPAALTSASGFAGVDGVFRFGADGRAERRLAVYEVTGSGTRIVAPAARSFAPGT